MKILSFIVFNNVLILWGGEGEGSFESMEMGLISSDTLSKTICHLFKLSFIISINLHLFTE